MLRLPCSARTACRTCRVPAASAAGGPRCPASSASIRSAHGFSSVGTPTWVRSADPAPVTEPGTSMYDCANCALSTDGCTGADIGMYRLLASQPMTPRAGSNCGCDGAGGAGSYEDRGASPWGGGGGPWASSWPALILFDRGRCGDVPRPRSSGPRISWTLVCGPRSAGLGAMVAASAPS